MYSVGFVTHQDHFLKRKQRHASGAEGMEALFLDAVQESETVRELVEDAVFQHDVRVEQDFSYTADSFCGPGYFLAGDSACFLDPLLSTGVHLGMYSGMLAAASILAVDAGEVTEDEALSFYEALYRNAYARMYSMVSGFYEQYRGKATYFWLAQRLARGRHPELMDREANAAPLRSAPDSEAFAALTAGALDLDDAQRAGGAGPLPAEVLAERMSPRRGLVGRDAATGLYLVTSPRLGIGRAGRSAQAAHA